MSQALHSFAPQIVLCVAAHLNDLEVGCSGSVATWVAAGVSVHYLICTNGGKGSEDSKATTALLVERRQSEQRAAAEILGVTSVTSWTMKTA